MRSNTPKTRTQAHKPASVTAHPNDQSRQAIADFVATGHWPEPGTMPVRTGFAKRFC